MIINNEMVFDKESKRFRLNNDYVYNELGVDLDVALMDEFDTNLSTIADRTLKYISNQLYDYIEANAVSYETTCYLIATNTEWYNTMRNCLGYQLQKFIIDGDDDENYLSNKAKKLMLNKGFFHIILRDIPERW